MLNHHNDMKLARSTRIAAHRGQPGGGLRAVREYDKGEQVFDYYGQAPNLVLLCEYGFALPNNHLGTPTVLTLGDLQQSRSAAACAVDARCAKGRRRSSISHRLRQFSAAQGQDRRPAGIVWKAHHLTEAER